MDALLSEAFEVVELANRREIERRRKILKITREALKVEEERFRIAEERRLREEEEKLALLRREKERNEALRKISGGLVYSKQIPALRKEALARGSAVQRAAQGGDSSVALSSRNALASLELEEKYDFCDRAVLPGSVLEDLTQMQAPSPLLFMVYPSGEDILSTSRRAFISVDRFSKDDVIYLPGTIMTRLGLTDGEENEKDSLPMVTLVYAKIPQATGAKFRPLQPGFNESVQNVLVFLEKWLQSRYAIISAGDILPMVIRKPGMTPFRIDLLVESVTPEGSAVSTINADINISILDYNTPASNIPHLGNMTPGSGSLQLDVPKPNQLQSVPIEIGASVNSHLGVEESHYFKVRLNKESISPYLVVYLNISEIDPAKPVDADADIYAGVYPVLFPTRTIYTFSSVDEIGSKKLVIPVSEITNQTMIFVAVIGGQTPALYTIKILYEESHGQSVSRSGEEAPNTTKCSNCHQYVPSSNVHMHEAFCRRNITRCTFQGCNALLRVSEKDSHLHCDICSLAVTKKTIQKHKKIMHENFSCSCGASLPLMQMKTHVTDRCPLRIVLCRFCNTEQEAGSGYVTSEDRLLGISTPHENECGSRTAQCPQCSKFILRKRMELHMEEHAAQESASQEGSETSQSAGEPAQPRPRPGLTRRSSSTLLERPVLCPVCSMEFRTEYQVAGHLDSEHFNPARLETHPFICTLCTRSFDSEDALLAHYEFEHS